MTQYVVQIEVATQRLVKSYEVTVEDPVRPVVPEGRIQAVITDTQVFNDAVAAYAQYKGNAHFTWDGTTLGWEIV